MAQVVTMPKLGFDMAEGKLIRWAKSEGEAVAKGEILAEIETDKATVEVEADASGVVHRHLVAEGTSVPVGTPIAVIAQEGEQVDLQALAAAPPSADAPAAASVERAATPVFAEDRAATPAPDGHLPDGVRASPVARRLAETRGLDLRQVRGSGPGGRVVKRDVEQAQTAAPPEAGDVFATQQVALSRLRTTIGRRMLQAKQQVPHFYVTIDVAAEALMSLRQEVNDTLPEGAKTSVNDFVVKAAALALREFPNLNASLDGERIVRHGQVNIGVAVAVDDGLLTVVVREADRKPLQLISTEVREMAARARAGRVRPSDIEGSTFSVSNLGMFDVESFIAIINPPEAAILAVGSVRETPVVQDGALRPGKRMKVTLSADHRVTDGAEAARWLQVLREYLEHPLRLAL